MGKKKSDKSENQETEESETLVDSKEDEKELNELEDLNVQLEEKTKEVDDFKDRYLRLQAETENFKRRMREEKARDAQFANERLLKGVIPIYENLGRALEATDADSDSLKRGVDMILKEFTSTLEKEDVRPIPTVGETFDPAIHEALSQVESKDHEDHTVLQEVSKGFFFKDRVLRPARVVISKKLVEQEAVEEGVPASETANPKTVQKPQEKK